MIVTICGRKCTNDQGKNRVVNNAEDMKIPVGNKLPNLQFIRRGSRNTFTAVI